MKTCAADLSIWRGGGAERRKKGEQQRERPRGSGQGLFKPHYSLSQFLRVECVGNWSSSFFFPHYIKPTKRFPVVSCY